MRAAREWGVRSNLERRPLLPGLARGGNAQTGTRRSGAPPLEPPSPRVRAQGREQATTQKRPPSPRHASPEAPRMHSRGATGRVVHDRAACKSGGAPQWPALLCTQERHAYTCRPCVQSGRNGGAAREGYAQIRSGAPLTPALERRANGRGRIGKGCAQQGAHARAGSGVRTPFASTFARNRGPGRADTNGGMRGGLYGMERTQ
ncbi:hypothetical protein EDB85DRAFT_1965633, partial [Lactarius pseudohatsudake]